MWLQKIKFFQLEQQQISIYLSLNFLYFIFICIIINNLQLENNKNMFEHKNQNSSFFNTQDLSLTSFIQNLDQIQNKEDYKSSLQLIHTKIYQQYAPKNYVNNSITKQLYMTPVQSTVKVEVPNSNSLIDSMFRTTLGCEEQLAHSYLEIIDTRSKVEGEDKQKRIQWIKKSFSASNSYTDFIANSKAVNVKTKYNFSRPVVDNQHESYIKTHLAYMQKPSDNKKIRQYSDRQTDAIAKKITQIGGIEDTVSFMEQSLQVNELNNTKNRQDCFKEDKQKQAARSYTQKVVGARTKNDKLSWVNKYKQMRETITSKLFS